MQRGFLENMLNIKLLGHAHFYFSDQPPNQIRSSLGCALFGYLIRQPGPVNRTELSELFWPDLPSAEAKTYLRNVLRRLKVHFDPWIRYDRKTAWVELDDQCRVDLLEIEAVLDALQGKEIGSILQTEVNDYKRILSKYEPFMKNFRHTKSDVFLRWLDDEDQKIQERVMRGYVLIAHHQLVNRRYEGGLAVGKRMMEIDESDPKAWKVMMQCHYMMGNFNQSQLAFERFESQHSGKHPDVAGAMELLQLYREIGRVDLDRY